MNYQAISKDTVGYIYSAYHSLSNSPLDQQIRALVELRASQINGCSYCCKVHTQDALKAGVQQNQLDSLSEWKDGDLFNEKQKIALSWCEALTTMNGNTDSLKNEVVKHFNEREFVDLTLAISLMNALNRIAINLR